VARTITKAAVREARAKVRRARCAPHFGGADAARSPPPPPPRPQLLTRAPPPRARARPPENEKPKQELRQELLNSERLKGYFAEREAEGKLLRHDAPLSAPGASAPHLKHIPAYLRDPAAGRGAGRGSFLGNAGPGALPARKRRRADDAAAAADPLKAAGFVRAPRRGGAHGDDVTDLEARALSKPGAKKRAAAADARAGGAKKGGAAAGAKGGAKKRGVVGGGRRR